MFDRVFGYTSLAIAALQFNVRADDDPAGIDFFENKIRPVLVQHCYRCHSEKAKKVRGKLKLDTRDSLRKGGRNGPAVIPGNVEKSLILKAIRYEGPEMPPKGKLPPRIIADFEKWVKLGAPDPRVNKPATVAKKQIDYNAALKHWAFRPIGKSAHPKVKNAGWAKSPIDYFILRKLEDNGLTPSAAADRRTLIRRLYFDLIGLPPTYEEVESFLKESEAKPRAAYEKVVDRLLASPHYGERWGRHWLDVARYADTKDLVLLFGNDRLRPFAYTYRDYVIRAFNEDVPFDRFIHEQLAADLIEPKVEPWKLAALGFLTLGRLFDNNLPDIYDDQIDTVTRGFLGLTVSCARCHDHKYDAIPQADYYSLYGIFAGCEKPIDRPLIATPEKTPGYLAYEKRRKQLRDQLHNHIETQHREITDLVRLQTTKYLRHVSIEKADPLETTVFFLSLSPNDLRPHIVIRWRKYLQQRVKANDPVFGPWHDLMGLAEEDFPEKARQVAERWRKNASEVNPLIQNALNAAKLENREDVVRLYGDLLSSIYLDWKKAGAQALDKLTNSSRRQLLEILAGPASPTYFAKNRTYLYMSRVPRGRYSSLLQQLDRLAADSQHAPPRAMALVDSPEPYQPRIFIRGNPRRPGGKVPRQFLHLLSDGKPQPFIRGSGRLELARAITARDNPLTARVIVNRVWMHHFGKPLVDTPNDFGVRSRPPSHPDLLNWLAHTFMADGWSLKKLHRRILLSATYQQSSGVRSQESGVRGQGKAHRRRSVGPDPQSIDPENRLLAHFPRRPMDLESMRDTMLALSGRLDRELFGRPQNVAGDANNRRRTVYGLVDRQDLPNLYRIFNFANPDQSAEKRPETTVPQQALFSLNSPFMVEQAKALAALQEIANVSPAKERINMLYRRVLQRDPSADEVHLGLRFIWEAARSSAKSRLSPWEQYAQVLLLTNELMFVE